MHMAPHKRDTWQSCHSRHPFRDGPGHKNLMSGVKCHGKDFSFFTILRLPFFSINGKKKKTKRKVTPHEVLHPKWGFHDLTHHEMGVGNEKPPNIFDMCRTLGCHVHFTPQPFKVMKGMSKWDNAEKVSLFYKHKHFLKCPLR